MTRPRQNRIYPCIITKTTTKRNRATNSMFVVFHYKTTRSAPCIAHRIGNMNILVGKNNAFTTYASAPELVLDKFLPLSFLRGIIRTDFGKVERTNFRSKG